MTTSPTEPVPRTSRSAIPSGDETVTAANGAPAVELRAVDKWFGQVHANRRVDLSVSSGTVHGIVGENGAGKTTLMNILYGFYRADRGQILIAGKPVVFRNSGDAIATRIGMIHQHFMLVETFTAVENVMLGAEGSQLLGPAGRRARRKLAELEREFGLQVPMDVPVGELPVGQQQRVEILKALYRGADILVLDEPTSVLSPREVEGLFRILRTLAGRGKTIILITHKLAEIMAATDRVSVMRSGAVVAHRRTADTTVSEIAELMVGRQIRPASRGVPVEPGRSLLDVDRVTVRDSSGVARVHDVSFSVRAGEIVGIAGVAGNGQSELLEALAGLRPVATGRILVDGEPAVSNSRDRRRRGVAHVPEDRRRSGLVMPFRACESAILGYHHDPRYGRGLRLDWPAVSSDTRGRMEAFDVRPANPQQRTAELSGGNQQKLMLAREVERATKVLLVGQPTRGVDLGGVEFIHDCIRSLRDAGKAILLVSANLDEILDLSDRVMVMAGGRIMGKVPAGRAAERDLGLLMGGVRKSDVPDRAP